MTVKIKHQVSHQEVDIQVPRAVIKGYLTIPQKASGIVLFAHGAGSSRLSPRNQHVAEILQKSGFATLLMDLLSEDEERIDIFTGRLRFNIPFLAGRVDSATDWILDNQLTCKLRIGYFGASTGAAAALVASIQRPQTIGAIVSRGGRPGLVDNILPEVKSPTLLIVGSNDTAVLEENQISLSKLTSDKKLVVIPGATHLFEEPGKLDVVANHAKNWFRKYLENKSKNSVDCPGLLIETYSFGNMTINGRKHEKDLIIFPDKIKDNWRRKEGHQLWPADIEDIISYKPEILVVGTGQYGQLDIETETKDLLLQHGIKLIEERTEQAVAAFNKEMEKGRKVVGAFHLTC